MLWSVTGHADRLTLRPTSWVAKLVGGPSSGHRFEGRSSPSRSDWDGLLPLQVWGRFCSLLRSGHCSLGSWVCVGTSVGLSTLGWSLCVLMPGFSSSRGQVLDGTSRQATGQLGIPPVPRAFAVSTFGPCDFLTVVTAQ